MIKTHILMNNHKKFGTRNTPKAKIKKKKFIYILYLGTLNNSIVIQNIHWFVYTIL